jgi:hypothetical protein
LTAEVGSGIAAIAAIPTNAPAGAAAAATASELISGPGIGSIAACPAVGTDTTGTARDGAAIKAVRPCSAGSDGRFRNHGAEKYTDRKCRQNHGRHARERRARAQRSAGDQ